MGAVSLLYFATEAGCWSTAGHERIAKLAVQLLGDKKRKRIGAMMHGDLTEFADWEERMAKLHPLTQGIHEHRQRPEWSCTAGPGAPRSIGADGEHIRCDGKGADQSSLFCALAYFFDHFAHDAVLDAYPEPKEPILTPKRLIPLEDLSKAETKPSQFLRWLAMLIGDLHQPLHLQRGSNDFGRRIKVTYQGSEYSLFQFWEDLPKKLYAMPSQDVLQRQFESRAPGWWDKRPTELFRQWMNETSQVLCSQILALVEATASDGANEAAEGASPIAISEENFQRWRQLAEDLTTLAGQRLAFLLSDILVHRKHRHAHKEGRGHGHHKKNAGTCFLTNVGIAAVLIPGLLWMLRYHYESPSAGGNLIGQIGHAKK